QPSQSCQSQPSTPGGAATTSSPGAPFNGNVVSGGVYANGPGTGGPGTATGTGHITNPTAVSQYDVAGFQGVQPGHPASTTDRWRLGRHQPLQPRASRPGFGLERPAFNPSNCSPPLRPRRRSARVGHDEEVLERDPPCPEGAEEPTGEQRERDRTRHLLRHE